MAAWHARPRLPWRRPVVTDARQGHHCPRPGAHRAGSAAERTHRADVDVDVHHRSGGHDDDIDDFYDDRSHLHIADVVDIDQHDVDEHDVDKHDVDEHDDHGAVPDGAGDRDWPAGVGVAW